MEKIIIANLFVFLLVAFICTIIGLDLKKWRSWLAGLYGLISGCLIGFLNEGGSTSWQLGLLFAIAIISSGAVMRYYRIYYRKAGKEWLVRYGQQEQYSFLGRIIEKLFMK